MSIIFSQKKAHPATITSKAKYYCMRCLYFNKNNMEKGACARYNNNKKVKGMMLHNCYDIHSEKTAAAAVKKSELNLSTHQ